MKNKMIFIPGILICVMNYSCSSDVNQENPINPVHQITQLDFENSKKNWINFKDSVNNSYKYVVKRESWIGTAWETTITVNNGLVRKRHFKFTGENSVPESDREWVEMASEINTHPYSPAADALTLDEVYLKAKQDWLIPQEDRTTYFEAKNNGLISYCGYVEDECVDDCFIGIIIISITAL